MEEKTIQKYLNWIGRFLVLLSLIFVFRKLWEYKTDLLEVTSSGTTWIILLTASVIYGGLKFTHALGWYHLLQSGRNSAKSISRFEALIIFGKTHIAKYIPGNIFHYTSRHIFAKEQNLSDSYLIKTTILEIIIVVSISFFLSLLSIRESVEVVLELFPAAGSIISFGILLISITAVIGIVWLFRERIVSVWKQVHLTAFFRTYSLYLLFFWINILFFFGMIYIVSPDFSLGADNVRFIIGGYSIGWLLGFLVPGAPGGIGIREAVLMALLGGIMQLEILLAVIILFRIVTVTGDFIHFLYTIILEKAFAKKRDLTVT